MKKITLIKSYRNRDTLRLIDLQELMNTIRTESYKEQVRALRYVYPLTTGDRTATGELRAWQQYTRHLPRICFALQQERRQQQSHTLAYTGLVLLEVNNLTGQREAEAIRCGAAEMPQTLATFVGASGQSVKIVCRGQLFPSEASVDTGHADGSCLLPVGDEAIRDFHQNLYERARLIYNGQLGVTIEKLEPLTERICYMSADAEAYYNPLATPVYARAEKPAEDMLYRPSTLEPTEGQQGSDRYISLQIAYEFNLSKAFDDAEGIDDRNERRHVVLTQLAQYCLQTGIPMAVAQRMALTQTMLGEDRLLVRKVFENVYRDKHEQNLRTEKQLALTTHMPPEALLTMKINTFLNSNYELRKNVMRGVAEYRQRTGLGFAFQDLTEEARNSITMRALELGIRCWDKDIRRYVSSNDIASYDPLHEYLERLPRWDGRDRVTEMARRVPTNNENWTLLFHIWMRSMTALWMGRGQLTGNALVPLLIGRQGCGKSSFCRILLPRELRDYYNDRISFKNEADLNLGLTSFALINLDEFDRVTQRQQIVLKYLVSTADLKYRPPYGKAYSTHRRHASFIGTTNEPNPLTDLSGSRRFICTEVVGDIDFQSPVDYPQLYAQLKHELSAGQPYWLSKAEEQQLMQHNLKYQRINGLSEMLMSLLCKPHNDEEGQWMNLKEISALLVSRFRGYREEADTFRKIGACLKRPDYHFDSRHTNKGILYKVKLRE